MTARISSRAGKIVAAAFLLPVLLGSTAMDPDSVVDLLVESGTIKVSGTSNVHDWTCEAKRFGAELQVRVEEPGAVPGAVSLAKVTVPVGALDCGDGKMDDNLRKALDAKGHPTITFAMTGHEIVRHRAASGSFQVLAKGSLTIAGSTRPIALTVDGMVAGDRLRIRGSHVMAMTDFGVKPPTAMLGVMKTGDRVTVEFDLATRYGGDR